ncbi:MAG: hypothetical protein A3I14_07370 [Candidatus Rokubacteria bacterium RIFCSPLOWO2_02_FULL_73_56]|nr:MAG: hypothetical protein A3D33_20610 [Candidatus Rokubacteria bacterium RIFCSPHIGHO2_02_FULL_73_26]OGL11922.1 MAG: hypothetical protein A3I14_07370 [Candidatus Rokubacteria bacterium RIFCSPLOWO2_02_FULL_73_56]
MSHPAKPIDPKGAALALLISCLWGGNPVAIKLGLLDTPPLRLAAYRFVLGGLAIAAWAWATGRRAGFTLARREVRPLGILAVLFTLQIATLNIGTSLTSAAHSAILLNLYGVHTVVLAHFLIPGDRLTVRKLAGALIAYAGIVILFGRQLSVGAPTLPGDVIMVASSLVLGVRTVYMARVVQRLDPVKVILSQVVAGTVVFAALTLLAEPGGTRWTLRLGLAIAYQGLLIAGFNFVVNLWLLQRYRPSALAGFFLTQPLFGVLAAAAVMGDPLTPDLLVASVAVAIGIGLTSR